MTYNDIRRALAEGGIDGAEWEAALLICGICKIDRAALLASPDRDFDSPTLSDAVGRRLSREPLQYILGEWGFCNEKYILTPDCLIPRPDTELLVGLAAKYLPRGARFVDVGCGSGCVAISLLSARDDLCGVAVDISAGAISVAKKNAGLNGVGGRLTFVSGDMRDAGTRETVGKVGAVISNPPYIPSGEIAGLAPELSFEPVAALDGGVDGLDFYRCLIGEWKDCLDADGMMIFETGVGQTSDVAKLAADAGFLSEVYYDIEKRDRCIRIFREK